MLEQPPGLSWRADFRAMVGLVRVGPERRRPGVGPGRDAAGWSGGAPGMDEVTRILSAIITAPPGDVVALDEQAFSTDSVTNVARAPIKVVW